MSGFAASKEQRAKVSGGACLVCLRRPVHPAHLCDRSLGGCDHEDCVVGLCEPHHRAFDEGALDLLPYLEPGFRTEQAHAVMHLGLARAYRRITNQRREAA